MDGHRDRHEHLNPAPPANTSGQVNGYTSISYIQPTHAQLQQPRDEKRTKVLVPLSGQAFAFCLWAPALARIDCRTKSENTLF